MDGVTIATPFQGVLALQQRSNENRGVGHFSWFSSIPPERKGLHGEYDYYGLSKRVFRCLSANIEGFRRLKVRQRGRVVVLSGHLSSPYLLREVVDLALSVDGVDAVETYGVRMPEFTGPAELEQQAL